MSQMRAGRAAAGHWDLRVGSRRVLVLTLQQGEAGAGERGDPLYLQGLGVRVFPEEQVYKQLLFWGLGLLPPLFLARSGIFKSKAASGCTEPGCP